MNNPYIPNLVTIEDIRSEVRGARAIKTFRVSFQKKEVQKNFSHIAGQTAMVSLLGKGECMFAISSSPTKKGYLEFSVMRAGKVTSALHQCEIGDTLAVRGPYGNGFPVDD